MSCRREGTACARAGGRAAGLNDTAAPKAFPVARAVTHEGVIGGHDCGPAFVLEHSASSAVSTSGAKDKAGGGFHASSRRGRSAAGGCMIATPTVAERQFALVILMRDGLIGLVMPAIGADDALPRMASSPFCSAPSCPVAFCPSFLRRNPRQQHHIPRRHGHQSGAGLEQHSGHADLGAIVAGLFTLALSTSHLGLIAIFALLGPATRHAACAQRLKPVPHHVPF
jgi:hypothetical protein